MKIYPSVQDSRRPRS